jgi:cytochrome c-type biogenesis protein
VAALALAFLAGLLSTLSPCVLPLLPIVIATALSKSRYGAASLAAGVALSYVTIGLLVATLGFTIGLDQGAFRLAAAVLLILAGGVLMVPPLQVRFAAAAAPIGHWAAEHGQNFWTDGIAGQFIVGLMLGVVWTPCVGPTLGAASILAARAENLARVAFIMLAFGIGAALPLLAIGLLSREALSRWRNRLVTTGNLGRVLLGATLATLGLVIVTGLDKRAETFLVDVSPAWLTALTTRF